jgi:hypothetical protein
VIDAILIGSLRTDFLIQYLRQFSPFLGILVSVILNHDSMLFFREVVLWRLVVEHKNALARFSLEVSIAVSASLCFRFDDFER